MIERKEYPPNYYQIIDRFPKVAAMTVIFAYDGAVYNPKGVFIPRHLEVHEMMHLVRQEQHDGGTEAWWKQYLADDDFRLFEEIT